jgi:hypothetical protein
MGLNVGIQRFDDVAAVGSFVFKSHHSSQTFGSILSMFPLLLNQLFQTVLDDLFTL